MLTRRLVLTLMAFTLLLPLSGCGCRRNCNSSSGSFAPPPCCPDRGSLPPGLVPSAAP